MTKFSIFLVWNGDSGNSRSACCWHDDMLVKRMAADFGLFPPQLIAELLKGA